MTQMIDIDALVQNSTLTGRDHPDTSYEAAAKALGRSGNARRRVLAALVATPGGMTDEELQAGLAMGPNTQRPRRVELVDAGFVIAGRRRRLTAAGSQSIVWEATPEGRAALAAKPSEGP